MKLPALHFHQVSVQMGDADILQNINFDLDAGEILAIVGPNGAGKSTLIKVALGLIQPQKGHAAIFGKNAGESPERIGYVPQLKTFDRTFPARSVELVVSGLRQSWPARVKHSERVAAQQALADVGAPQLIDRPLARLSGGELQRVYLARSLIRQPDIILLDEPATGVDFLAEHDLYDLLERYQKQTGATIVMITHDLAAARYHASRVVVLNRIVHGYGKPAEVLCKEYLQKAYGHFGHAHGLVMA